MDNLKFNEGGREYVLPDWVRKKQIVFDAFEFIILSFSNYLNAVINSAGDRDYTLNIWYISLVRFYHILQPEIKKEYDTKSKEYQIMANLEISLESEVPYRLKYDEMKAIQKFLTEFADKRGYLDISKKEPSAENAWEEFE